MQPPHPVSTRLIVIDFDPVAKKRERAIGEDEADVDADQGTAAAKNKPHEAAHRPVLFHTVAIVDPDERKVLHVVENFEERNPGENVE